MELSVEEILRQAPDEASAKAARGLVVPAKWPTLGATDTALWGECQGSGSKPYQVQIDMREPAFKCSCPSRKFPCKHGLALMLLRVQHRDKFAATDLPAWVNEWQSARAARVQRQEQKKAQSENTTPDPANEKAAVKREATRAQRMQGGLDELARWLADRVTHGLAQLPATPQVWDDLAARMVDAQLPGLAASLRALRSEAGQGEDWPERVLGRLGRLQILVDAARRLASLPEAVQVDIRTALGQSPDKDAVLTSGEQVADRWFVLGQCVEEEDRLFVRRVWLIGLASGRHALLVDFAHGARRFEPNLFTGRVVSATLVFFPSAAPLRAVLLNTPQSEAGPPPAPPAQTLADALQYTAQTIAANPWLLRVGITVHDGVVQPTAAGWALRHADGPRLPLRLADEDGWTLTALGGGQPLTLFGEWDGERLRALSAWSGDLAWAEGMTRT